MIEKFFIEQGLKKIELDKYLKGQLDKAGFTKAEIVKTPLVTRIVVNVTRPGLAIGKSGQNIKHLTEQIGKIYGIDNPQLEIREIQSPELVAQAVVDKIKASIERGLPWRSVAYRTASDIMSKGAQGVELILSGKLAGKGGRKKQVRIAQGYLKKVGDQAKLVDFAKASAYPKPGAIGIKVRIVRPDTMFPDKIKIVDYLRQTGKLPAEFLKAELDGEGKEVAKEEKAVEEKTEEIEKAEVEKKPANEKKAEKEKPKAEKPKEVKKEKEAAAEGKGKAEGEKKKAKKEEVERKKTEKKAGAEEKKSEKEKAKAEEKK